MVSFICKTDLPAFHRNAGIHEYYKRYCTGTDWRCSIRCMTDAFKFPGAGYVGPVPTPVILMVVIFVIAALMINKTQLGRHIYAVGGNVQAAKFSGISVQKVKFIVYAYTGVMAGIAGVVIAPVCIPDSRQPATELRWMPLHL